MVKQFLYLEWKSFVRSASMGSNLAFKIFMAIIAVYFSVCFALIGSGIFYILKEHHFEPLGEINKILVYYFIVDLIFRLLLQSIPVANIRPLLSLPIKRKNAIHFSLGKSALSFFNLLHAFFFVPFSIVLLLEGYNVFGVACWFLTQFSLVYSNNFLNILLSNKKHWFLGFIAILIILYALEYYAVFDISQYSGLIFGALFQANGLFLIPVLLAIGLYFYTFCYFKKELYLDAGLSIKTKAAKIENLDWLNKMGSVSVFLKNDIKLIKRNKRSRTTLIMSALFLCYGFLIFGKQGSDNSIIEILGGIIVSGGFLFTFGQFVPSWDSAYYPLLMTQSTSYRDYINSKWVLIVIGTIISTILASFYLFMGLKYYLIVVAAGIYNIGVNSSLVLLAGAFTKTPIDLASSQGAFGDKKAFNIKSMLLALPKMLLPLAIYWAGNILYGFNLGLLFISLSGIIGFAAKPYIFNWIESIYKAEKYKTLAAYKEKL